MIWLYYVCCAFLFQLKSFTVVNMQGKAFVNRKHIVSEIKPGFILFSNDSVQFENKKGTLRLAGVGGTFLLKPDIDPRNEREVSVGIWSSMAKSMVPTKVTGEMKARGGAILNQIDAETFFKDFQSADQPMLVLDVLDVPVSNNYVTDTSAQFFYLAYKKNSETINKRIPFKITDSSLNMVFDARLFLIDGKNVGQSRLDDAKIFMYEKSSQKSVFISDFNIRFERFDIIKKELCLVEKGIAADADNKTTAGNNARAVLNYLRTYYGRIDEELFFSKYYPKICKN